MLSDIISLMLMMAVPMLLYMGLRLRMRKDASWKKYLIAAGGVFIVLVFVAKH